MSQERHLEVKNFGYQNVSKWKLKQLGNDCTPNVIT